LGGQQGFYYAQVAQAGNFSVQARLHRLTSDGQRPVVGVMIRERLTPRSRFVALATTATGQYYAAWRPRPGSPPKELPIGAGAVAADGWVRLVREGDLVSLFTSADGATWTWEQTVTVRHQADSVNVGLFILSGEPGVAATATVTDFSLVSLDPP
jgi:hypothetical protein